MNPLDPDTLIVRKHELLIPKARWHLGPLQEKILWALCAAPRPLSVENLSEFCYGDDESGGPLSPRNSLYVTIQVINDELEPHGWRIDNQSPFKGGCPAVYRMART